MGYDAKLGGRIRSILGPRKGLSEKEMFGGLAFLRDGKMFVGIIKDELMARVGKDAHEEWERKKGARTMDFTHRPMKGYLQVRPQGFAGAALKPWVEFCWEHIATVEKRPKKKPRK
jgi:hypothetical protein